MTVLFSTGLYVPRHHPNKSKYNTFIDSTLFCGFCGFVFMMMIQCLFILWFPRSPMLFGSILPNSTDPYTVGLHILFLVSQIYFSIVSYQTLFLNLAIALIYGAFILPFISNELRLCRKRYHSISKTRESATLIHVYRSVEVFHNVLNNYIGVYLLITQFLITILFCFTGFMVMKHSKHMSRAALILLISWAIAGPFVWSCCLVLGGYLHSHGHKLLISWKNYQRSWRYCEERKIMEKFRNSCRPLCLAYKTVYILKRVSLLLFIKHLSRGIMRALLTLGQNTSERNVL